METRLMDSRLADHLLWRLRHRAEADAIDYAVEHGILAEELRTAEGRKVRTFAPGPAVAGKSEAEITRLLQGGDSAGSRSSRRAAEDDEYGIALEALQGSVDRSAKGLRKGRTETQSHALPDTASLLQVVRRSAAPLRAVDVATTLLVAQPVTMGVAPVADILEALRVPSPIITVTGRVAGFEETLLDLLGSGLILPGKVATCKGTVLSRDGYGLRFSHNSDVRWHVVAFQGSEHDTEDRERTARQVFIAARSVHPIIGVCEDEDRAAKTSSAGRPHQPCLRPYRQLHHPRDHAGGIGRGIGRRHHTRACLRAVACRSGAGDPAGNVGGAGARSSG